MSLTLSRIMPELKMGFSNIGFLFGAGTSLEAGYPLMDDLTKSVVSRLDATQRGLLEEMLSSEGLTYDGTSGKPNIEEISDLIAKCKLGTQKKEYIDLESKIRSFIVDSITSIGSPCLDYHVQFIEALKRRANDVPTTITILTTNYDILFEMAAGEVGIRMESGFDGPLRRSFNVNVFDMARGTMDGRRFNPRKELHINLIKLHGSIAWIKNGYQVYESTEYLRTSDSERSMILPRREKVIETLSSPFDILFTKAYRILGSSCKYVVSCGFSYSDKHINDQLIFPKLDAKEIRLAALCRQEPDCLAELKKYPSFAAGFPNNSFIGGADTTEGTNLWEFKELVNALSSQ